MKTLSINSKTSDSLSFNQIAIIIFIFVLATVNGIAQATLPHHEPINYTIGQGLQSQTGWTSLNSGDALLISSGNLSYTGLPASTGNKVTFDGDGIDAAKLFTQQTSGTVFYSFLLNVTSLGSLNTTGGYFTGFTEGTGTTFGATVWLRADGAGYDIGINPRTTAANTVWSTGTTAINTTLFIVISYQIVSGTSNDVARLWINPTPGGSQPAATLTATNTGGTDLANVNRLLIRQATSTTTPFVEMDELRVGTTWASVTPGSGAITTVASGLWTTASIWSSGTVPGSGDDVVINHTVYSGARTRNSGTTTTIGTSGMLSISGAYTCTGATTAVNGTFEIDDGGSVTGDNFVYGANGTLGFHNTSPYTFTSTSAFWPASNGPNNVYVIGSLTINSTTRNIPGLFSINGTAVISSSTMTINNCDLDGSVNFGDNTTVTGEFKINSGGVASGGAPIYSTSSTLRYNTNTSYNRNHEWSSTTPFTKGYPNHVHISNTSTILNMDANSGANTAWAMGGNLTVNSGCYFNIRYMNVPVTINGNIINNGGYIPISQYAGGDLRVGGSSITGDVGFDFTDYVYRGKIIFLRNGITIINSCNRLVNAQIGEGSNVCTLQLNCNLEMRQSDGLFGQGLIFNSSSDVFDINGFELTLGSDYYFNYPFHVFGDGFFKGSSTSSLRVISRQDVGTIRFLTGFQSLYTLSVEQQFTTGTGVIDLGSPLTLSNILSITRIRLRLNEFNLTLGSSCTYPEPAHSGCVITDGTGQLRKQFTSSGNFTYYVGNLIPTFRRGTANIAVSGGGYTVLNVGVGTKSEKHPSNEASTDYLNRYWSVTTSGATGFPTLTGTYYYGLNGAADINGNEANYQVYRWNGTIWNSAGGTVDATNNFITSVNTVNAGIYEYTAGFPVTLQEINVKQGSTNYLTGSTFDFGTVTPTTNSDVVFTVQNIGFGNLNLGSATVSGTGFSLFSNYATPISGPSNSSDFTIRFSPTTSIPYSGSVSIPNNDPDGGENPYVIYFTGQGSGNNQSDIIYNGSSTESQNENIAYINYQSDAITNTGSGAGGSIGVMGFTIRDGGASNDADSYGTELTAISFTATNWTNIRSARLFNGTSPIGSTVTVTGATISFTGLTGVVCADNSTLALNLRVTFKTAVTDNQKMVFTISSATAGSSSSSSTFAAGDAGGAVSNNDSGSDINRIEVVADRIVFSTQPSNTLINVTMSSVQVRGRDVNGNNDLDYTGSIEITSSGTLTGSPISQNASAGTGIATFSGMVHTVAGSGLVLTATTTGLTINTVNSNTFNITSEPNNSYRTIGSGVWNSNSSSPAIWERLISGTWQSSNSPAYNTSNNVYIRSGHTITTNGSFGSSVRMFVQDGGALVVDHSSTCFDLTIHDGGYVAANAALSISGSGTLTVEDNATLLLNHTYANPNTSIWNGVENFHPNSNLEIWWAGTDAPLITGAITTNTYNSYTAALGNVYVDFASGSAYRGNTTFGQHYVLVASSMHNRNISHKNFEIASAAGWSYRMNSTATVTTEIGGDLILSSGMGSSRELLLSTGSGTLTLTVKGDVVLNCAGDLSLNGGSSGATILNVEGDILMNQSNSASTTEIRYHTTTYTPTVVTATINLKGNLFSAAGGISTAANVITAADGSNPAVLGAELNFVGDALQLLQVDSTIGVNSTDKKGVSLKIKNGASVQLYSKNLRLNQNSSLLVEDGGTFDFGFNGTTPLLVTQPGSSGGSNWFKSNQGSTLKITSPDGITTTASLGNVQVSASNRSFNNTARFWYIGKANQVTGNAITTGSTGKVVIAELDEESFILSLTNNIGISNETTIEATGGRLDIRKGIVLGTNTTDFSGSGRLVMTGGTYRIQTNSATVPLLENYANYSLTGGVVEMNATGNQILSGAPASYYNVAVTGDNVFETNSKRVTSNLTINNNLSISGSAVFDSENNSIAGNAGLTMTGGRFRMAKLNETLPQLLGIATPYNLSAGIVELYGTSATQTHSLRGTYNAGSNTVQYYHIELNANAANVSEGSANVVTQAGFGLQGIMNVNNPTCFKISAPFTIQDAGVNSTFDLKAGATLKYGSQINTTGNSGDIRTDIRIFPATASYGFVGNSNPQNVGTALPSSMVNMYLDKESNQSVVINQNTNVENALHLMKGKLDLNNYNLSLGTNSADASVSGGSNQSYIICWNGADNGNLFHFVNNDVGQYLFPIGDLTSYTPVEIKLNTGTSFLPGNPMLVAKVIGTSHPNKVDAIHYLDHYWNVEPIDFDSTNYNIWFDYDEADLTGTETAMYPCKYNSLGWIFRVDAPASYVQGTGTSNYSTNHIEWNNLTSFSDFTLIGGGEPLPIELLDFTAIGVKDQVQLNWTTASETNNQYFTVERAGTDLKFVELFTIPGAGTSNQNINYQDFDRNPYQGANYYRLKQTDFDGQFTYSDIAVVNFDDLNPTIRFFVEADNQDINIIFENIKDRVTVQVFDLTGKEIHTETFFNGDNKTIKRITSNYQLSKGIYLIRVSSNQITVSQKIRL